MKSKHEGYDNAKDKLLAVAAEQFTLTGVHGTSLNDIANSAGLAKGTLYYHYPAKEDLVSDVVRAHGGWVTDTILSWVESLERDSEPSTALMALLNELMDDPQRRKLHIVLLAESCLDDPALAELVQNLSDTWAVMFEVGALKLRLPEARRVRSRSGVFFSMLLGYMCRPNISKADKEEFIEVLIG